MGHSFHMVETTREGASEATVTLGRDAPSRDFAFELVVPLRSKYRIELDKVIGDTERAAKAISPITKVALDLKSVFLEQQLLDLASVGYREFGVQIIEYYTTQFAKGISVDPHKAAADLGCGIATIYRALNKISALGHLIKKGTFHEPSNELLEQLAAHCPDMKGNT